MAFVDPNITTNTGNTNPQECPQGQHWDAWKGMCVADSPLGDGLGTGTDPTTPTTVGQPDPALGAPSTEVGEEPGPGTGDWREPGRDVLHQCEQGERWNPFIQQCVPTQFSNEEGEGFMPWINNLIAQGITDATTFFRCDWANGFIWDPAVQTCVDASQYANDPDNEQTQNLSDPDDLQEHPDVELQQRCTQNGGIWDWETKQCTDTQGNPMDPMQPNCPSGYEWDYIVAHCVPLGESSTNQQKPGSKLDDDYWDKNIVDPDKKVLPDKAPSQFGKEFDHLRDLLSEQGGNVEEDRIWNAKIERMNQEYDKSREQLEENLNVSGLYYSGARADQLRELEENRLLRVEYMAAEFEHEAFNRELARKGQAIQAALGMKELDIKYALGQGQLTVEQLSLALEEKLGMGALDIQQQGLDVQVMGLMAESAMAEAATELERQNIWLNVVTMLYEMGLSEEEVQAMYAQIAGQNRAPSY